jgi:hypothetical protein
MTYDNNGPIYSNLLNKTGCTGDCQCEFYWYDYDLEPRGDSWPGAYGWYGNNTCGNCYVPGTPENDYNDQIPCGYCDSPSFDGTANGQIEYTPCYRD